MVSKFICDHHCKTLLVERVPTADPDEDGDDDGGQSGGVSGGGPQSLSAARRSDSAVNSIYNLSVNVQFSGPRYAKKIKNIVP